MDYLFRFNQLPGEQSIDVGTLLNPKLVPTAESSRHFFWVLGGAKTNLACRLSALGGWRRRPEGPGPCAASNGWRHAVCAVLGFCKIVYRQFRLTSAGLFPSHKATCLSLIHI